MNQSAEYDSLLKVLQETKSITILLPYKPSLDQVAASLALFLSLQNQIDASIACPLPMTVNFSRLVGVNKITTKLGGRSLIISLDYLQNAIDKVSYNIEGQKFNLVIQPKAGHPPLSSQNVNYSYSGDAGLLLTVGIQSLEDLTSFYQEEKKTFTQAQIINLDLDNQNTRFGKVNLIDPQASSYSEIVAQLLSRGNFPLNQDIANNLLLGVQAATNNFSSPRTTPTAFETASLALRAGARLLPSFSPTQPPSSPPPASSPPSTLKPMTPRDSALRPPPIEEEGEDENQVFQPQTKPPQIRPKKSPPRRRKKKSTPPDWFGPKVYRGSTRI